MPKLLRDILEGIRQKDVLDTDNLVCRKNGYHDWRAQKDSRIPDKCASCGKDRELVKEDIDSKMPRHEKDKNAWYCNKQEHFNAIRNHTVPATLQQMTNNRFGRSVIYMRNGPRIEKEKGLLKQKVPHLLG
jgi:hypothetical protein